MERERTGNDLCTPRWITAQIETHMGPIALDPCSNQWSTVDAACRFMDPEIGGFDGLEEQWASVYGVVYVNPPYGRGHLRKWAQKMCTEAEAGAEIIALVPVAPSTAWWRLCLRSARVVAYFNRRVAFDGGAHGSGSFDSAMFYWGPRPYLFAHAFSPDADIRHLR